MHMDVKDQQFHIKWGTRDNHCKKSGTETTTESDLRAQPRDSTPDDFHHSHNNAKLETTPHENKLHAQHDIKRQREQHGNSSRDEHRDLCRQQGTSNNLDNSSFSKMPHKSSSTSASSACGQHSRATDRSSRHGNTHLETDSTRSTPRPHHVSSTLEVRGR